MANVPALLNPLPPARAHSSRQLAAGIAAIRARLRHNRGIYQRDTVEGLRDPAGPPAPVFIPDQRDWDQSLTWSDGDQAGSLMDETSATSASLSPSFC
jgi:hypothetical protein